MAKSEVEICNVALGRAGCNQFINSLDDPSIEAITLKQFYMFTLERVLQDFPWSFANRYVPLQDIGDPVQPWAIRYRYPSDCLQAHRVVPAGGAMINNTVWTNGTNLNGYPGNLPSRSAGVPYKVIGDPDADGKAILCDFPGAVLDYTARITKVGLFPPAFASLFAWALCGEIVTPLAADPKYAQVANQTYNRLLAEAGALSFSEGQEDAFPDGELLAARDGY